MITPEQHSLVQYLIQHQLVDVRLGEKIKQSLSYAQIRQALLETQVVSLSEMNILESLFSGFPLWDDSVSSIKLDAQSRLPLEISRQHRIVCVDTNDQGLVVITDQHTLASSAYGWLGNAPHIYKTASAVIDSHIDTYAQQEYQEIISSLESLSKRVRTIDSYGSHVMTAFFPDNYIQEIAEDISSEKLLQRLIVLAEMKKSNCIIFQHRIDKIVVRMKIGDQVHDVWNFSQDIQNTLYIKLRYLCDLPLETCRSVEQGSTHLLANSSEQDKCTMVTFIPTTQGVTITLDLHHANTCGIYSSLLHLSNNQQLQLEDIVRSKSGIIVLSGDTQSGKTYAYYRILETAAVEKNTVSFEKQSEYTTDRVDQLSLGSSTIRDLLKIQHGYEVFGFSSMVPNLLMSFMNMAQHKLLVVQSSSGVMGIVKKLLSAKISKEQIAETLRYNVISYKYSALEGTCDIVSLNKNQIATLQQYVSLEDIRTLIQEEGVNTQGALDWYGLKWKVLHTQVPKWYHLRMLPKHAINNNYHVRSLVDIGSVLHQGFTRGDTVVAISHSLHNLQKRQLARESVRRALRQEISIHQVIDMLRT